MPDPTKTHSEPTPYTPPHKPPKDPDDPQKPPDEDDDEKEDEPPKDAVQAQQQLADLNKQVAKARRQEEKILEHSSGVIPPLPAPPTMAELAKAGGGK